MTKRDMVIRIANETGMDQRSVAEVVQKMLDQITDELAAGRGLELRNFGVFDLKVRKARTGRNPKDPEVDVPIPERVSVKFKPGKIMKDRISKLKVKNLK